MNLLINDKLEEQLSHLQQAVSIAKVLIEKRRREEEQQNGEFYNLQIECQQLRARIVELESRKCESCEVLQHKLAEQHKLNKSANSRLKSIASLLCPEEGGQTSSLTNAQWSRMTQILEDPETVTHVKKRKLTPLIADKQEILETVKKFNSKIMVPETIQILETQVQNLEEIVVPETQTDQENVIISKTEPVQNGNLKSNVTNIRVREDTTFLKPVEEKVERLGAERQAESPPSKNMWTKLDKLNIKPSTSQKENENLNLISEKVTSVRTKFGNTSLKETTVSPSVISEELEECNRTKSCKKQLIYDKTKQNNKQGSIRTSIRKENSDGKKESYWKLKPSLLIKADSSSRGDGGSKRKNNLKQTTLSLRVKEKKHDISTSETFNGGVANSFTDNKEEDSDVVFDSPQGKGNKKKILTRRRLVETKDLDETLFQPPVTSVCVPETENYNREVLTMKLETNELDERLFHPPVTSTCIPTLSIDNSYDRLPEAPKKSPNFKYKRDSVRKREERIKLPGWSCDECAEYYKIAGQSWSKEEIKTRMNACSKHRDKYPIRPKTPPGFWDPVIPPS